MASFSESIVSLIIFVSFFSGKSEAQLASGLYVFGDSTVDVGNNNNLKINCKYSPYGIDFPGGATGRNSNGLLIPDFIAQSLGLASPPAIRQANSSARHVQGFNYASSSAGILPESGFVGTLSLVAQVALFKKTVEEYLPQQFKNPLLVKSHLSKSIFLVVVGVNDYALGYIGKRSKSASSNEDVFASLLVAKLGSNLQDMYKLGARKFVVFNIEPLGCLPHDMNSKTGCLSELNSLVIKFNNKLPALLTKLASKAPGSKFILGKNYEYVMDLVENPQKYGFKDSSTPCCGLTQYGTCDGAKKSCPDRNAHVFFDGFHPTQATYKIIAQNCFNGAGFCQPINIKQLASL